VFLFSVYGLKRCAGKRPAAISRRPFFAKGRVDPRFAGRTGWRVTSDESSSIRTSGYRSSRLHRLYGNDWHDGIRNRLPQRDCSGLAPDSMTLSWLVGARLGFRLVGNKAKPVARGRIRGFAMGLAMPADVSGNRVPDQLAA